MLYAQNNTRASHETRGKDHFLSISNFRSIQFSVRVRIVRQLQNIVLSSRIQLFLFSSFSSLLGLFGNYNALTNEYSYLLREFLFLMSMYSFHRIRRRKNLLFFSRVVFAKTHVVGSRYSLESQSQRNECAVN